MFGKKKLSRNDRFTSGRQHYNFRQRTNPRYWVDFQKHDRCNKKKDFRLWECRKPFDWEPCLIEKPLFY